MKACAYHGVVMQSEIVRAGGILDGDSPANCYGDAILPIAVSLALANETESKTLETTPFSKEGQQKYKYPISPALNFSSQNTT